MTAFLGKKNILFVMALEKLKKYVIVQSVLCLEEMLKRAGYDYQMLISVK